LIDKQDIVYEASLGFIRVTATAPEDRMSKELAQHKIVA
jgi:hypothetical protein